MEIDLDVGDWRDTVSQMNALLDQINASAQVHRSETDRLAGELRKRVIRLETVIRHREREYDALQEQICKMRDQSYLAGFEAGRTPSTRD